MENGNEDISFELEFASNLFNIETIKKFANDFLFILDKVSFNREIKLEGLKIEGLVVENTEIENVTFHF
ncbi:hypothetical protein MGI18_17090 [Bacillus sp. OVS6]|nr:hypothetical protein MGI18_17090 [Bacillus sp. OVS6]